MKMEETVQSEENALIRQAAAGDRNAFDRLMERHTARAFGIARKFGLSTEDAADVVQDAFLSAYKALPSFNFTVQFATWFTRILINRALNHRRWHARAKRYFLKPDSADSGALENLAEDAGDPQERLEQAEFRRDLNRALRSLPAGQEAVFVLFELEGMRLREIAAVLKLSEGTVASRLHYARHALRKKLAAHLGA